MIQVHPQTKETNFFWMKILSLNNLKGKEKSEFFLLSPCDKVLVQLAPAPLSMVNGLCCQRNGSVSQFSLLNHESPKRKERSDSRSFEQNKREPKSHREN